jgi:hypothetical protein
MSNSAPDQLEIVRSFVNTYDHEDGSEDLADPSALTAWLEANGLGAPKAAAADLEHARQLREALRAILHHHGGTEIDPSAPRVVDAAASRSQLAVRRSSARGPAGSTARSAGCSSRSPTRSETARGRV